VWKLYLPSELGSHISAGSPAFSVCRICVNSSFVMVPSLTAARSQRRAVLPKPLRLSTSARGDCEDGERKHVWSTGQDACGRDGWGAVCRSFKPLAFTPYGARAAAICAVHENDLQVPLKDPLEHARVLAACTAIGEGDAGHGKAGAVLNAVRGHLERGHLHCCTEPARGGVLCRPVWRKSPWKKNRQSEARRLQGPRGGARGGQQDRS